MKKLKTKIMHNGEEKEIAVLLDDETARILEECGDEKLKHRYIVEEYKAQLIERRETRRQTDGRVYQRLSEKSDPRKRCVLYRGRADEKAVEKRGYSDAGRRRNYIFGRRMPHANRFFDRSCP